MRTELRDPNELVKITLRTALDWDGDPETEGAEHYEPGDTLFVPRHVARIFVAHGTCEEIDQ